MLRWTPTHARLDVSFDGTSCITCAFAARVTQGHRDELRCWRWPHSFKGPEECASAETCGEYSPETERSEGQRDWREPSWGR